MSEIYLSGFAKNAIVDSENEKFTITLFLRKPEAPKRSIDRKTILDAEKIKSLLDDNDISHAVLFKGDNPFAQSKACLEIAKYAHQKGLSVHVYTPNNIEKLQGYEEREFLNEIDYLFVCDGYEIKSTMKNERKKQFE